jgi:hypothetical protein
MGTVSAAMALGCLVKVTTRLPSAGPVATAYVVSEQDADRAINIIKGKIATPTDEVVVVSRVSEELLHALGVAPGGFTRADGHPG